MEKIIIDADGAVLGRVCSFAAKSALNGYEVIVVNSERSIITGIKNNIIEDYANSKRRGGHSLKGPKLSRSPELILKRCIRGMIPNIRKGYGREVLKKIKCYKGIPAEFAGQKTFKIPSQKKIKYISIGELSQRI